MEKPINRVVFFIDQKKYETTQESLTVRQIIESYAKVDPNRYSLALKKSGGFDELEDLNQVIKMKDGMHFSLFDKKPTPVS
jgi:hypothetical protein